MDSQQKKLDVAEEFLEHLESAWASMPAVTEPRLPLAMQEVLTFARSMVASALDPNSVSQIREYRIRSAADHVFEGGPLLCELLCYLLEKAHDAELDGNLECFQLLQNGMDPGGVVWQIVGGFAQVETAPELFAWLYAKIPASDLA